MTFGAKPIWPHVAQGFYRVSYWVSDFVFDWVSDWVCFGLPVSFPIGFLSGFPSGLLMGILLEFPVGFVGQMCLLATYTYVLTSTACIYCKCNNVIAYLAPIGPVLCFARFCQSDVFESQGPSQYQDWPAVSLPLRRLFARLSPVTQMPLIGTIGHQ